MIRHFSQGNIDRIKWDRCISNSKQKLIYGYSWYLDLVSPGWEGLVEDDYKAVMPLTIKRKWGFNYLYQPLYTQQLGVYSGMTPDLNRSTRFFEAIPSEIRYIDYSVNNLHQLDNFPFKTSLRVNYELKLNHPFQKIASGFTENTRRNIKKSLPYIDVDEDLSISEFVKFKRKQNKGQHPPEFYEWLNIFIEKIMRRGKGFIVGGRMADELVAAAFFLMCGNRIYYLVPVSDRMGKKHRAMFAILDYIIEKYADTGLILDFEGSGIEGIARFFAGFGAQKLNYYHVAANKLPFLIKAFKK